MQLLPFHQNAQKSRSFFSGFRAGEPPHPLQQGCNRMGGNDVLCREDASDEFGLSSRARAETPSMPADPQLRSLGEHYSVGTSYVPRPANGGLQAGSQPHLEQEL